MRATAWVAFASIVIVVACDGAAPRPPNASQAIAKVQLRHTTEAEVRSLLGEPDDRPADGSLVYRFARGHGRDASARSETVRFAFERGKLSKICRDRS